jgi:hypothetical protein
MHHRRERREQKIADRSLRDDVEIKICESENPIDENEPKSGGKQLAFYYTMVCIEFIYVQINYTYTLAPAECRTCLDT